MPSAMARLLTHTTHLVTFVAVLLTGVLLFAPNLRAAFTGGYSLVIRDVHRWGGVAFALLPLLVIAIGGPRQVFDRPLRRSLRRLWQGAHMVLAVLMSVAFTATGLVLWGERRLSEPVVDFSRMVHDWLTYAAVVLVATHLFEIGLASLVARFGAAAAASPRHSGA